MGSIWQILVVCSLTPQTAHHHMCCPLWMLRRVRVQTPRAMARATSLVSIFVVLLYLRCLRSNSIRIHLVACALVQAGSASDQTMCPLGASISVSAACIAAARVAGTSSARLSVKQLCMGV